MDKIVPRSSKVLPTVGYEFVPYSRLQSVAGFYWGQDPESSNQCPECYSVLDCETVSPHVIIKVRKDAVCAGGRSIVSPRFRDFCLEKGYDDIVFHRVEKKRELYEMRPTQILEVDMDRSRPLLTDFCRRCGNFESYLFGVGLFLDNVTQPIKAGFYRTDLIWGCSAGKHPVIIVAETTMREIKAAGLTGITFRAVPYVYHDYETRKAEMKAAREYSKERSKI